MFLQILGLIMRWETETRWYEAFVYRDLFDLVVVQRWGGKSNQRHGELTSPVDSLIEANKMLTQIERRRQLRGYKRQGI